MNTTPSRPTPETDAEVKDFDAPWLYYVNADFARKLERERDERREYAERCKEGCIKLSFAIDRIDYACGNPNEMEVSDYALHQNEEHVVQRVKEKLEAMREAIKEAYQVLQAVPVEYDSRFFRAGKWTENALAKLQPFIKP